MAESRVEKRRLDGMRREMDQARQQIQQDSPNYRQVEISEAMWEQWNRPVRFLQSHHEAWHEGGQNMVERILTTMKGEGWPEGRRMIAQISWERLLDLGHRINPAVREGLMQKIRDNDLPLADGRVTGMRQALDGKVPIQFKIRDYMTDADLTEGALVRVFPYEKELDAQGLETGNYKQGKPIYHGLIKDGRISVDLSEGFYLFKVYLRGYAVSPKTLHITLEDVRHGISGDKPLDFAVEVVPKNLVPKGMTVVPEMEVYIGDDPTLNTLSPFEMSSQPQHKVKTGPFLIDKYMTTVREYREFLEAKLKEIQEQLDKDPKMRQGQRDLIIKASMEPFLPMEALNKKTKVSIKEKVASAVERVRRRLEKEEDPFYWNLVSFKEGKKRIWKLNNPKNPEDHHGVPIDGRQPVEAISQQASMEFLKWRAERDQLQGREYRLGKITELEGTARGGFPWIYPFGDRFDPFKVTCRSCFPDVKKNQLMRVGRHPTGATTGDRSPLGPVDLIGNAREFTSSYAEKDATFVFGGSVSTFNSTHFKPSNRMPMLIFVKFDSFSFRKVLDLPKINQ
jgi:formylglycine-generating enzyme required for sulfatase activity